MPPGNFFLNFSVASNFERGDLYFHIFSSVYFFGGTNLKLIEKQERFWGGQGHAPSKNFLKFTGCNGYFSAFCIVFRQILFKCFNPKSECFAKHDACCSQSFH